MEKKQEKKQKAKIWKLLKKGTPKSQWRARELANILGCREHFYVRIKALAAAAYMDRGRGFINRDFIPCFAPYCELTDKWLFWQRTVVLFFKHQPKQKR